MTLNKWKLVGKRLKISFVDLGEGRSGEFNPHDPKDIRLLRLEVQVRKGKLFPWTTPQDCSLCTQIPVNATDTERRSLLMMFYKELLYCLEEGRDLSGMCEVLSWAEPDHISQVYDLMQSDMK